MAGLSSSGAIRLALQRIGIPAPPPRSVDCRDGVALQDTHWSQGGFPPCSVLRLRLRMSMSPELQALIEAARNRPFTAAEREAQHRSFPVAMPRSRTSASPARWWPSRMKSLRRNSGIELQFSRQTRSGTKRPDSLRDRGISVERNVALLEPALDEDCSSTIWLIIVCTSYDQSRDRTSAEIRKN